MNNYCLSLGSNLGDRIAFLQNGYEKLSQFGKIISKSSYYRSESWGYESENYFINCCVVWQSALEPLAALELFKKWEYELGRIKDRNNDFYTDRNIDIDIIFVNQLILNHELLIVPHPKMYERKFVLVPLEEIAGDWIDPVSDLKISDILLRAVDDQQITKIFL